MANIWDVTQDKKAAELYSSFKDGCLYNVNSKDIQDGVIPVFIRSESMAVNQLTNICLDMIEAYNDVIVDQDNYILEIDNLNNELNLFNENLQSQIEQLRHEIEELNKKQEDGTITEEEKDTLKSKNAVLKSPYVENCYIRQRLRWGIICRSTRSGASCSRSYSNDRLAELGEGTKRP